MSNSDDDGDPNPNQKEEDILKIEKKGGKDPIRAKKNIKVKVILGACLMLLLLALINITIYMFFPVKGNEVIVKKEIDIEKEFEKVNLAWEGDIYLKQGTENKIEIEGDENVLDQIKVNVKYNTLTFKPKLFLRRIEPTREIKVYVTFKNLENISLSGKGNIYIDSLRSNKVKLKISGKGLIDINELKTKEINLDVSGDGKIKLNGKSSKSNINITGFGDVQAKDCEVETVIIKASGKGEVQVNSSKKLDINIAGSLKVIYTGDPEELNKKITGSGVVEKE